VSVAGRLPTSEQPPQETQDLRKILGRFSTGVTVVTASHGKPCGMTANAFTSVSLNPPSVLVCVHRGGALYQTVRQAGGFAVSVLSSEQEKAARHFADHSRPRGAAEFGAFDWSPAPLTGAPVLDGALAWLDCALTTSYDGGDHEIFLGKILASGSGSARNALVFFGGTFHQLGPDHR
jgi:flavin reductase (DIM6/NTAB) family NADH-FMN oxidoreductase RutF